MSTATYSCNQHAKQLLSIPEPNRANIADIRRLHHDLVQYHRLHIRNFQIFVLVMKVFQIDPFHSALFAEVNDDYYSIRFRKKVLTRWPDRVMKTAQCRWDVIYWAAKYCAYDLCGRLVMNNEEKMTLFVQFFMNRKWKFAKKWFRGHWLEIQRDEKTDVDDLCEWWRCVLDMGDISFIEFAMKSSDKNFSVPRDLIEKAPAKVFDYFVDSPFGIFLDLSLLDQAYQAAKIGDVTRLDHLWDKVKNKKKNKKLKDGEVRERFFHPIDHGDHVLCDINPNQLDTVFTWLQSHLPWFRPFAEITSSEEIHLRKTIYLGKVSSKELATRISREGFSITPSEEWSKTGECAAWLYEYQIEDIDKSLFLTSGSISQILDFLETKDHRSFKTIRIVDLLREEYSVVLQACDLGYPFHEIKACEVETACPSVEVLKFLDHHQFFPWKECNALYQTPNLAVHSFLYAKGIYPRDNSPGIITFQSTLENQRLPLSVPLWVWILKYYDVSPEKMLHTTLSGHGDEDDDVPLFDFVKAVWRDVFHSVGEKLFEFTRFASPRYFFIGDWAMYGFMTIQSVSVDKAQESRLSYLKQYGDTNRQTWTFHTSAYAHDWTEFERAIHELKEKMERDERK